MNARTIFLKLAVAGLTVWVFLTVADVNSELLRSIKRKDERHNPPSGNSCNDLGSSEERHLLFALSGNHSEFIGEFEVALKSVLLNAPRHNPLKIHIMADQDAYDALEDVFYNKINVSSWNPLPTPIQIHTYNVQPYQKNWTSLIEKRMAVAANMTIHSLYRHTIGAYFRLFTSKILPKDVDNLVYLDTDVVVMAPLDDIWERQISPNRADDKEILFYWGNWNVSGFIVLRPKYEKRLWDLYSQANVSSYQYILGPRPVVDDQHLFQVIQYQFPQHVGTLDPEWDVSAADGPWKFNPKKLLQARPNGAGILHFNGGGESPDAFYNRNRPKHYREDQIWNLAKYYVDLPWSWVKFQLSAQLKHQDATTQPCKLHLLYEPQATA